MYTITTDSYWLVILSLVSAKGINYDSVKTASKEKVGQTDLYNYKDSITE